MTKTVLEVEWTLCGYYYTVVIKRVTTYGFPTIARQNATACPKKRNAIIIYKPRRLSAVA